MKLLCKLFFVFSSGIFISSCNKHFTKFPFIYGKNKIINSTNNLPSINLNKDSLFIISSISHIDRFLGGETRWRDIPEMGETDRFNDNHFKLILKYIDSLKKQKLFSFRYIGTNKNDSIYKSIYDSKFQYFYDHNMVQKIDFTNVKKDGVYLVITFLLQISSAMGGGFNPSGGGVFSNTLYEFFQVQNGKAVAYSGFSLGRNDSFRKVSQKGFPKYRDVRKAFEMLYEQSAKAKKGKE